MSSPIELFVGLEPWQLTVPPERLISVIRPTISPPADSAANLMRAALEHPFGFEALRRALTPDDSVTIVLDPSLPEVPVLLGELLAHLRSAGIPTSAVTILTSPGSGQGWVDDLPDEFADAQKEIHDPVDRQKLSYLSNTESERRVYLNRTLVDAGYFIVLSGRRYDPLTGYAGAEAAVFPALADEESRASLTDQFSTAAPGSEPWPVRAEAAEILWLLGTPFLVQVIEGEGDQIQEVVAGLPTSSAEGIRRQDARWRATVSEKADVAIVTLSGNPDRLTFLDVAKAAARASRVVRKDGRIAILCSGAPDLGDGARLLRSLDGPTGARKLLKREKPDDLAACLLWVFAAKRQSLFLASDYPDNVVEELFATPIHTATEVQRLIDSGGRVLLIPDGHKSLVEMEKVEEAVQED